MPKKNSDIALAKVPSFANRVSLFQSKLQITRHAPGTITDYCYALYKAVSHVRAHPPLRTALAVQQGQAPEGVGATRGHARSHGAQEEDARGNLRDDGQGGRHLPLLHVQDEGGRVLRPGEGAATWLIPR